jgi:CRP/FNR family cyclic AMP-dependent transcriptional regulator
MTEFWTMLTEAEAAEFTRRAHRRTFPRDGVLFHEGETSDSVLVLAEGRVKAYCDTAGGAAVLLAVRGPGALLGELAAVDRQTRSATIEALEPVTALIMPLPAFEDYLATHGRVALVLARIIAERLRDADRKRIEFGASDATGRVAARLVELAERFGKPAENGTRIALPLSQDELAGWIGASREAVSKALQTLRASGWVSTSRMRIVVHDMDALRQRAQDF